MSNKPDNAYFSSLIKPYNVFNDDLVRISIHRYKNESYLFFDACHVLLDGFSFTLFIKTLYDAYKGLDIVKENMTIFDISETENKYKKTDDYKTSCNYFMSLFKKYKYTSLNYKFAISDKAVFSSFFTTTIDAEIVDSYCNKYLVSKNLFFVSILLKALYIITNINNPMINVFSNGRTSGKEMNLLCARAYFYPV